MAHGNPFDAHSEAPRTSHLKTLKVLLGYLWSKDRPDLRNRVSLSMVFLIIGKLINVTVPFILKAVIDELSIEANLITVPILLIIAFGLTRVMSLLFGELRDYVFVHVAQHTQRELSKLTFAHLHTLSLNFHLSRQTGGISRIIERASRSMQFVLRFLVFNIFPTLFEIFLVLGILFFKFDTSFALAGFFTLALYIGATLSITDLRIRYRRKMNETDSRANTHAIDSLLNYETVKYFGNEDHELNRYDDSLGSYEQAAVKSQLGLSTLNFAQGFVISSGLVVIMILAGKGVASNSLTVGDFVMVHTLLMQLFAPLNFLGFVYREIKEGLVDMDKMFEVLSLDPDIKDSNNSEELQGHDAEIEFENVSFRYIPERPILKNISFKIGKGKSLAIVGPSGSGKSTIARLLFRFWDVEEGKIRINRKDVRNLTQASVRAAIGVVPQDTVLFNDTIGYNISYGRPGATQDEVHEAARLAQVHKFIERLPGGYTTVVGERGLKLSGGEKQRVAIARTILKNPPILLLDEATSALDSHTEKEIQKSLREISKGRTTVMIAHRLSTVVDANEIIVLEEGEIVERGRHDELLKKNGEYAKMWRRQQEVQEMEEALKQAREKEAALA